MHWDLLDTYLTSKLKKLHMLSSLYVIHVYLTDLQMLMATVTIQQSQWMDLMDLPICLQGQRYVLAIMCTLCGYSYLKSNHAYICSTQCNKVQPMNQIWFAHRQWNMPRSTMVVMILRVFIQKIKEVLAQQGQIQVNCHCRLEIQYDIFTCI